MKKFIVCTLCAAMYLIPMSPFFVLGYICKYIYKGCEWVIENCPLDKCILALRNKLLTIK